MVLGFFLGRGLGGMGWEALRVVGEDILVGVGWRFLG